MQGKVNTNKAGVRVSWGGGSPVYTSDGKGKVFFHSN